MAIADTFTERFKTRVHIIQIVLIVIILGVTFGRVSIPNPPISRSSIMAIPIGIKSLIIIAYQMLSEHSSRFKRWRSLKANMILDCLETVFWLAVIVVTAMGAGRGTGATKAIAVVTVLIAIVLEALAIWAAACSTVLFRQNKRTGRETLTTEVNYRAKSGGQWT
ncbi:uncharacterized protein RHO25_004006 [Cercospora beticola]|uniref:MARVEL domain-containing protein n=2 Tax=Cercospora beticola TaxID=122368 RepID=A0ABZ0NIT5_CERBT|nr:hypothetical protein RHO25_004006 [Cercospora beticola]CAK1362491.1 unnamed protein product [Cercospora beticola]